MNHSDIGATKIITTGVEVRSKIIQGLLKAPELGSKMFLKFVKTKLLEKWKVFIHLLHEKIYTGNNKHG